MGVLKVNVGDAVTPVWRKIGCGGGATSVYSDAFTRADSSTSAGPGWAVAWDTGFTMNPSFPDAVFGITSNQAYTVRGPITNGGAALDAILYRTDLDGVSPDFDMSVTVTDIGTSGANFGNILAWRWDPTDGSHFTLSAGSVYRIDGSNNSTTVATWGSGGPANGDVYRVVCIGNVHTVYRNGSQVATFTDAANNTATRHGICNNIQASLAQGGMSYARKYDDFSITVGTPVLGRLKLWDGSQWWREVCDDDAGGSFSDDFNRANGAPGNGWVEARRNYGLSTMTWAISSNRVTCTANASYSSTIYEAMLLRDLGSADFEMSFTVPALALSAFGSSGLAAWRADDVNAAGDAMSYFYLFYTSGGLTATEIAPGAGGGFTDGAVLTLVAGDVITVRCTGSLHEIEVNGVLAFDFTRTMNQTTGVHHGLASLGGTFGDNTTFDDFTISTPSERRPLKLYDGTGWVTVACMVVSGPDSDGGFGTSPFGTSPFGGAP